MAAAKLKEQGEEQSAELEEQEDERSDEPPRVRYWEATQLRDYEKQEREVYPDTLTPSEQLIEALLEAGFYSSAPWPRASFGKSDLTFVAASKFSSKAAEHHRHLLYQKRYRKRSHIGHRFQVVAQIIRAFRSDPVLKLNTLSTRKLPPPAYKQVFTPEALEYLRERGHTVDDVLEWWWIITAKDTDTAADRLLQLATRTSDPTLYEQNKAGIPLILFLLRRPHVSASALRTFIVLLWNVANNQHNARSGIDLEKRRTDKWNRRKGWEKEHQIVGNYPALTPREYSIAIVRLLRHARRVWPESLSNIAELLVTFQGKFEQGRSHTYWETGFWYNRMLKLVSLDTNLRPLQSSQHRQRAQLIILRKMSGYQPPLMLNIEGYRAVTRVQLAHAKTVDEREWALLKAKSWPPWKEDKLGEDEEKGIELGISRAQSTLRRQTEAGYRRTYWEQAASILSGWDTDNSPTIQTRTVFNPYTTLMERKADPDRDSIVWAARVRATRTLDEAWACFLAYREDRAQWQSEVCYAMFEKLVMVRQGNIAGPTDPQQTIGTSIVVPGDLKTVWPTSENPRERPYLRTPPPNEHRFIEEARAHGVIFEPRFLAFMVSHAETLGVGLQYIKIGSIPGKHKRVLLGQLPKGKVIFEPKYQHLLAAYIRLLCRFSGGRGASNADQRRRARISEGDTKPDDLVDTPRALIPFARDLIRAQKLRYRPAWYAVMSAVAGKQVTAERYSPTHPRYEQERHDIAAWKVLFELTLEMQKLNLSLDFDGFLILCTGLEKAIFATRASSDRVAENDIDFEAQAKFILKSSRNWLKKQFIEISDGAKGFWDSGPTFSTPADPVDIDKGVKPAHDGDADQNPEVSEIPRLLPDHMEAPDQEAATEEEAPGSGSPREWNSADILPRVLEAPSPAVLHAFMRVVGLAHDDTGILDLLKWMAFYAPEVQARAEQLNNGQLLTRRTIVCARVMLERWWDSQGVTTSEKDALIQEAQAIVENVYHWGEWPTDDECEIYVARARKAGRAGSSQIFRRLHI